jgi:hypothetical protein
VRRDRKNSPSCHGRWPQPAANFWLQRIENPMGSGRATSVQLMGHLISFLMSHKSPVHSPAFWSKHLIPTWEAQMLTPERYNKACTYSSQVSVWHSGISQTCEHVISTRVEVVRESESGVRWHQSPWWHFRATFEDRCHSADWMRPFNPLRVD